MQKVSMGKLCPTTVGADALPLSHLPVLQVLDVGSVVAVPVSPAQHPEPPPANGVHQGPPVRQQLNLPNLQHAAIVSKTGGSQGEKRRAELGYQCWESCFS